MPLVDYDGSEEEPESLRAPTITQDTTKALGVPPLSLTNPAIPRLKHEWFHATPRLLKHHDNHWPTHVYLKFSPDSSTRDRLKEILRHTPFQPLFETDLGAPQDLHVSLTETLLIHDNDRARFLDAMSRCAGSFQIPPQHFRDETRVIYNEQRTRAFLVLLFSSSCLSRFIEHINDAIAATNLDLRFLRTDLPHVSIGCAIVSFAAIPDMDTAHNLLQNIPPASFNHLYVKQGSLITRFPLNTTRLEHPRRSMHLVHHAA